jgi:hypothetical protein
MFAYTPPARFIEISNLSVLVCKESAYLYSPETLLSRKSRVFYSPDAGLRNQALTTTLIRSEPY